MNKKKKYSYEYSSLNLKARVVEQFRKFARKLAASQSDTLEAMLHFFEWHGFKPNQRFGKSLMLETLKNRKRTEANIAILRDIEQTQTKPLSIQMDLLFEGQTEKRERPKRVEKIFADEEGEVQGNATKEPLVTKLELDRAKMDLEEARSELVYLLERVKRIKPALGKEYLRLEMSPTRFETFKESIERKN